MDTREIRTRCIRGFFIIYACATLAFSLLSYLFSQERAEGTFYSDSVMLLILSILVSLAYWIFYSKEELTRAQFTLRHIAHFFVVQGIAHIGFVFMYRGGGFVWTRLPILAVVATMVVTTVIYVIVMLVDAINTRKLADDINEKLNEKFGDCNVGMDE